MGLMRFISPSDRISDDVVQRAYMSGYDRVPWPINSSNEDGQLHLERQVSDSGNLHIPWPVEGHGQVVLSTSTLMERKDAYHLPLELARGELSQLRIQLAEWQAIGLAVPEEVFSRVADATSRFGRAVCGVQGSQQSNQLADEAIRIALDAARLLAGCYTEQSLAVRRKGSEPLTTLLGADLGLSPLDEKTSVEYLDSFNAVNVPMIWRELETTPGEFRWDVVDKQLDWARAHGLAVCAGPLLQVDEHTIPAWLAPYEGDFDSILTFACEYIQEVVQRYRGRVDVWQSAARLNTATTLSLSEQERVTAAARAIELTRALDENAAIVVSFDQPCAEYLSRQEVDFPPLHFADALVRAGLGLTGVMLEISLGYHPRGTLPRSPLDLNRRLDYWSLLGVPLYLTLCVPSSTSDDSLSAQAAEVWPDDWDLGAQQSWINQHVPLLLSKTYVHGVFWKQLLDSEWHELPHGGLFDPSGHPKPSLRQMAALRKAYLR